MVKKENIISVFEDQKLCDRAILKALQILYRNQTPHEQVVGRTEVHNQKGFTGPDALIGTSHAKFSLRRGRLTEKQLDFWKKRNAKGVMRIQKYWRQLMIEANKKGSMI